MKVDKVYVFDSNDGKQTLADLFGDRTQLIVYHFMFRPDGAEGCPSCSFWADNFNGITEHLKHRNIQLLAVSRARLEQLDAYMKRLGVAIQMGLILVQ